MDIAGSTLFIHLLVVLFGAGAWIAVNGVWVELPVIVYQTPEEWNLPAYLTIISQVGNIGPIIVAIMQVLFMFWLSVLKGTSDIKILMKA